MKSILLVDLTLCLERDLCPGDHYAELLLDIEELEEHEN